MAHRHDPLFPRPTRPLDDLVRRRLDFDAKSVNADDLFALALRRLHRPTRRLLRLSAVVAAALIIGLFAIQPGSRAQARPTEVLAKAREVHTKGDRCYSLRFDVAPEVRRRWPWLKMDRQETIWTRGDRFRIEADESGLGTWGRDENGRVWVAPSRKAGAVFDAKEIPAPLQDVLIVRSVNLLELLGVVMHDCDLERLPADRSGHQIIQATPRKGANPTLVKAFLDIDSQHVVQRLQIRRRVFNKEFATITLQLFDTQSKPDNFYRLEGQLDPSGKIYNRTQPLARLRFMLRHQLGPLLGKNN